LACIREGEGAERGRGEGGREAAEGRRRERGVDTIVGRSSNSSSRRRRRRGEGGATVRVEDAKEGEREGE